MAGFVTPIQPSRAPAQQPAGSSPVRVSDAVVGTNTRTSLWPDRWPVIAKGECIELVEAAAPEEQANVKSALPCGECELNTKCLTAKRKEIGPLMYDREQNTKPRASGSSLFPMDLFKPCLRPQESLVPYWQKPEGIEHHLKVVQAWDLAWSERIGGDWLVCMTGLLDLRNGQRRLLDINRWRQISFDDQVNLISLTREQYQADLVVIESDAAQQIWAKHVGRNTSVPVLPHPAADKTHLAKGVPGLLISLSNRKWEIPYEAGSYHREHVDAFLGEAEAFGWVDGKLEGVGEHDDTVMCWWHLSWAMDRLTLLGGGVGEVHRGVQPGRH